MPVNHAVIVVENSYVPIDIRVWYEATTLRDHGWHVTVICPSPARLQAGADPPSPEQSPVNLNGIDVFYFSCPKADEGAIAYTKEYLTAFFAIGRLAWRVWKRGHFDVLQFCNPPDIFFPIACLYRLLGVAIIFDHHDLFPEFVIHRFSGLRGKLFYRIARLTEYLTYRCAHVVMSVNESYRRIAIRRGRLSPDRVTVVRNGPKVSEFAAPDLARGGGRDSRIVGCFVGVMGHDDGVLELVDSIRYLVVDLGRRDFLFRLVGDGAIRGEAMKRIEQWGLGPYVEMPGMVYDRQLVRQYLATSDIGLSPEPLTPLNACSTFIKVGEYMAVGKPVVAYDLSETHWTAQEAALYVTPGDTRGFAHAIAALADSPERRLEMGTYARRRFLMQLCWEHQQGHLLDAYSTALRICRGDPGERAAGRAGATFSTATQVRPVLPLFSPNVGRTAQERPACGTDLSSQKGNVDDAI